MFKTEEEAEKRAEELGCSGSHQEMYEGEEYYMPCKDHASYLASIEKSLREESEVEEKDSSEVSGDDTSVQGARFSDEVKDVLAALESLIVRATSIGELRKGDGRKLSEQATTALRAVQEDLNDAWAELDQLIEEVGKEPVSEVEETSDESEETAEAEEIVSEVEEAPAENPVEEPKAEDSSEEVSESEEEASEEIVEEEIAEAEAEVSEEVVEAEVAEEDDSELFVETQQILAEAALAELDDTV